MGLFDYKINSFSKPVSALDDTPQMSASELKEWFDSNTANELKQSVNGIIEELKDVDVSKQHTHDNKDVLDKITEEPIYNAPEDGKLYARKDGAWSEFGDIPSIVYTEIDNFLDGVCKVTPKSAGEPLAWDGEKFSEEYSDECITSEMYALCLAYKYEYGGFYTSHTYYQMLIFPDGNIYTRHRTSDYDPDTDSWSEPEWSNWTPFVAEKARNDENNRRIVATYATKEELTDKHTWKLLGEATVTEANVTDAGEDGVTSIAIDCGYLGGYDELRINLQCGVNDANASLPSEQRHFNVGILNDVSEVIGQDNKLLIFGQGSTNGTLNPTYTNNLIINSYFTDGILQYSEILNTAYNSHNYKTTPSVALPNHAYKLVDSTNSHMYGHPIDLKNGNHIVVFGGVNNGFKFPAGTELKVYGR